MTNDWYFYLMLFNQNQWVFFQIVNAKIKNLLKFIKILQSTILSS